MSHLEIFSVAVRIREPQARENYLDEACAEDIKLRRRVEDLLRSADEAERLLETAPSEAPDPLYETGVRGQGTAATTSGLQSGVLGDYRILREIGRGGMGVVYEAEQVSLDRRVALKVLPLAAMLDKTRLARFKNEARAAASLHHPNVVHVHSVGSERGVHYYAMQLIDGRTVAELIAEERYLRSRNADPEPASEALRSSVMDSTMEFVASGPSSPSHDESQEDGATVLIPSRASNIGSEERTRIRCVVELCIQVAEALEHAHQMGIVHRDIKPSNLLVNDDGHLWVADFGLAMIEAEGNLTINRNVMGTLRYMSPEQIRGDRHVLDHHTDIYSLGATLYEMLTLRPAYPDCDVNSLMQHVLNEEPIGPRKLHPAIPRDLEIITLKAMARDPEDRYTTAGELAADLRRMLDDEPILAKPPAAINRASRWMRRHRTTVFTAAATLLIAVFLAGALVWNERSRTLAAYAAEKEQHKIAQMNEAEANQQAAAADIARAAEAEAREAANREKEKALRAQAEAQLARKRAEREADSAKESELFARNLLYAGDVRLAALAWEDGDARHYMDLLGRLEQREEDLSGFELRYLRQLGRTGYSNITEGTAGTSSVRYSPDGSLIVMGQYDGSIRVLDTHSRKVVAEFPAHEGLVRCIDFSPDGQRMASTGDDGMIRVWHFPDCRPTAAFRAYQGIGFAVFFAVDGTILVSCGEAPNAQLWDSESGENLGVLTADVSELRTMTVSTDGKYCAGSGDGITFIWDLQERSRISRRQGTPLRCLQFSPDGKHIAAGANDKRIHMFSFQTGEIIATLEGHGDDIDGLAFHPTGSLLASADRGGVIRIWVLADGETVAGHTDDRMSNATDSISGWPSCFRAHPARVWSLDFSPDGNHLLSASKDGTVRAWNRRPPLMLRLQKTGEVMGMAFTKAGDELLVCQRDEVWMWSRHNNEERAIGVDIGERKLSITIAPDDATVVCGDTEGNIHLWNRKEGRVIKSFVGHEDQVDRIDISPSGEMMVTASWDGTAKLWDFESHEELAVFRVPPHCNDAAFSPDGELLAISSGDNVMLYDVSSRQRLHLLLGHQNTADCLTFSPDGHLLATGSHDRTIRLWDVETGKVRHVIPAHREKITAVAFSPDGRTIASGDRKGTLGFSHVETGRFLYNLQIATGAARDLKFAANGEALAAAVGSQVVLLQVARVPR